MARPLRIEFPTALYHITSRGNRRESIYDGDEDRCLFLKVLESAIGRFHWICHAYCLMGNHYHLLIETPDANLSARMREVNGVYTQRFNRWHNRVGHVFQGRIRLCNSGMAYESRPFFIRAQRPFAPVSLVLCPVSRGGHHESIGTRCVQESPRCRTGGLYAFAGGYMRREFVFIRLGEWAIFFRDFVNEVGCL